MLFETVYLLIDEALSPHEDFYDVDKFAALQNMFGDFGNLFLKEKMGHMELFSRKLQCEFGRMANAIRMKERIKYFREIKNQIFRKRKEFFSAIEPTWFQILKYKLSRIVELNRQIFLLWSERKMITGNCFAYYQHVELLNVREKMLISNIGAVIHTNYNTNKRKRYSNKGKLHEVMSRVLKNQIAASVHKPYTLFF